MLSCLRQVEFEYIINGYELKASFSQRGVGVAGKRRPAPKTLGGGLR